MPEQTKTPLQYAIEVVGSLNSAALHQQWKTETDDWYAYAIRADGLTLHFNTSHQSKNRLAIRMSIHTGDLNKFFRSYSNDSVPEITVAGTKTSAQIASEITRRLLPDADKLYTALLERKAVSDAYNARCVAVQKQMIDASNGILSATESRDGHGFDAYRSLSVRGWYMNNSYASADTVQLEFRSLPVELAEAIIRTVAEYEGNRPLSQE